MELFKYGFHVEGVMALVNVAHVSVLELICPVSLCVSVVMVVVNVTIARAMAVTMKFNIDKNI